MAAKLSYGQMKGGKSRDTRDFLDFRVDNPHHLTPYNLLAVPFAWQRREVNICQNESLGNPRLSCFII
ncbi:MAG: hypothetical protein WBI77_10525 [Tepidanaerobacteraceae bacterium]